MLSLRIALIAFIVALPSGLYAEPFDEEQERIVKPWFGDADIARLEKPERIEALCLDDSLVTDAGLADLARFPRLKRLHLSDLPVTDAGLAHLEKLTQLEVLI